MLSALGLALVAAIEPIGLVAFIAVLGSRGGRRNTRGFIVGWVLCACVIAVATTLAYGGGSAGDASTLIDSAGLLQVALGVVALAYLLKRHRRDPSTQRRRDEAVLTEEQLRPFGAAMIGVGVQGWPVVAAAVSAVLGSTSNPTGRLVGVAAVVLVSVSTYLTAHVLAGRAPERTAAWLGSLKGWIESHRDKVIDVLLLGAGGFLVVHGLVTQFAT